jgi:hypothetical protein
MNAKELKQHDKTSLHIRSRKNQRSATISSQSDQPGNQTVPSQSDMTVSTENNLNSTCNDQFNSNG